MSFSGHSRGRDTTKQLHASVSDDTKHLDRIRLHELPDEPFHTRSDVDAVPQTEMSVSVDQSRKERFSF